MFIVGLLACCYVHMYAASCATRASCWRSGRWLELARVFQEVEFIPKPEDSSRAQDLHCVSYIPE
eukprot:923371-Amphidinium_carterae.1